MIDEYNLIEGDEEFIDGSMELGTESPLEVNENKNVRKMNESQFRNYIYETVLDMLDEQMLNEDDPMAAGTPMPPAPGAGAPAPAAATDADALPGEAKKAFKDAEKFKDPNGGAKGFAPQDVPNDDKDKEDKDKEKKELAENISRYVFKQLIEQFEQKNI